MASISFSHVWSVWRKEEMFETEWTLCIWSRGQYITWLVFNHVSFVIGRMRSSEISSLWDIKHQDGAGENWEKDASLRRTSSLSFGDKIALQNCNVIEINRKLWKKKLSCSSYKRHSFISQLYFVCNFVIRNP